MKTQAGVVFGTPQYMSPEQGRGLPLDARSDLYALGILAFEMLTGSVPFHDDNPMTVIQMHLHAAVPPLPQSIPYPVQQIVRRALEKEPSRRYQSSGEMMQHCQQVFAELTQGNMPVGLGGQKTMIASGPPGMPGMPQAMPQSRMPGMPGMPGMPPTMPPGMPPNAPQMPMQASPQQATMIAQPSPFAQGGMPQGGMPQGGMPQGGMQPGMPQGMPPGPPPGGFQPASPMQKTIVAMAAPQLPGQMPGQAPPGYPMAMAMSPMGQMANAASSGPNKTVMLQGSEGIVSVARTGQAVQPAGTRGVEQGASTLFWIVSLVIGVAVGALAYVIVLQL
jgi:serine/threonine-protein kinase